MNMFTVALVFISVLASAQIASAKTPEPVPPPVLSIETIVDAPATEAWSLWTTNEGVRSFFPGAENGTNIELRPDGPYEFFFLPENPEGMRGCDGCKILGWQEGKMLTFTWTNRPDHAVRPFRTHVTLRFEELAPGKTRVSFEQDGWGEGADWKIAFDYFADGWARVLAAYRDRIAAKAPH